jgi:hypothetical protein
MKIYWYAPEKVFSSFKDPLDNPSFRLRCYRIHEKLVKDGYSSKIVQKIEDIIDPDIVILMSFGEDEYNLAKWVKGRNKFVLHDYCEDFRGIDVLERTKQLCDYFVCASANIADTENKTYPGKAVIIKDPIEESPFIKNFDTQPSKFKAVYMGMGGNAVKFRNLLEPIAKSCGMDYVEISNNANAEVKWTRHWQMDFINCDIALCPQFEWQTPGKSNVKVTTAMSLGLPVIASPIRSYFEIIDNGYNGFIGYNLDDWANYLERLKNKDLRRMFVINSFERLKPYKLDSIYSQWLALFKNLTLK